MGGVSSELGRHPGGQGCHLLSHNLLSISPSLRLSFFPSLLLYAGQVLRGRPTPVEQGRPRRCALIFIRARGCLCAVASSLERRQQPAVVPLKTVPCRRAAAR